MADNEVQIKFKTQAELQGAKQAEEAVKNAGKASKDAAPKMEELRSAAKGLAFQIPVVGKVMQGIISPITGVVFALASLAAIISERVLRALTLAAANFRDQSDAAWQLGEGLKSAADRNKEFGDRMDALAKPMQSLTDKMDKRIDQLRQETEFTMQLAEAQKDLEMAMIGREEALGRISKAEADMRRLEVEGRYGAFATGTQQAANAQEIGLRQQAIFAAKLEMERRAAERRRLEGVAGASGAEAMTRAAQVASAGADQKAWSAEADAAEERMGSWWERVKQELLDFRLSGLGPGPFETEKARIQGARMSDRNLNVVRRRASAAAERAAADARALASAQKAEEEARGRYGGLVGGMQSTRLARENAFLGQRAGIAGQTIGVRGEAMIAGESAAISSALDKARRELQGARGKAELMLEILERIAALEAQQLELNRMKKNNRPYVPGS